MSEPTWTAIPDNRAVGSVNPPGDMDETTDELGLSEGILAILLNGSAVTPVGPATNRQSNINAISSFLTSTAQAVLSTQVGATGGSGVAGLDVNGLVPVAELPLSQIQQFLFGTGSPSTGTGQNGDLYVDDATDKRFIKASGTWGQNGLVYQGLLASTGSSGYALVNGTGTIFSFTIPNDGVMHRIQFFAVNTCTALATGGNTQVTFNDPGGTSRTQAIFAAAQPAGFNVYAPKPFLVAPNQTITYSQTTALTAGGPETIWAEVWGS